MGAMLRAFEVKYMPQIAVKGQILADLMAKFTEELGNSKEGVRPKKAIRVEIVVVQCTWQLFMDGAAN